MITKLLIPVYNPILLPLLPESPVQLTIDTAGPA
jgi:hypothetical protein